MNRPLATVRAGEAQDRPHAAVDIALWLAALAAVAADAGSLDLEALTMARLVKLPSPSKRSRADGTPVLPHVEGGGPDGGMVASIALALTNPTRVFISLSGGGG